MSEQRLELFKLFGCLHNAVNEKPWDQMKVSGCLLDITTKFDYDDTRVKDLEAKLKIAVEIITNCQIHFRQGGMGLLNCELNEADEKLKQAGDGK